MELKLKDFYRRQFSLHFPAESRSSVIRGYRNVSLDSQVQRNRDRTVVYVIFPWKTNPNIVLPFKIWLKTPHSFVFLRSGQNSVVAHKNFNERSATGSKKWKKMKKIKKRWKFDLNSNFRQKFLHFFDLVRLKSGTGPMFKDTSITGRLCGVSRFSDVIWLT